MKCKKNFKKVSGVCVPDTRHVNKKAKMTFSILKLSIIASIVSIGGWALFTSIVELTGLSNLSPWVMGFTGISIIILATFIGWGRVR